MVQLPAGARDVSFLQTFQTGTGTHPTSGSVRLDDSFYGVKHPKHKSDHSPPSSVKVQKDGTLPDVSQKYNFSFTF